MTNQHWMIIDLCSHICSSDVIHWYCPCNRCIVHCIMLSMTKMYRNNNNNWKVFVLIFVWRNKTRAYLIGLVQSVCVRHSFRLTNKYVQRQARETYRMKAFLLDLSTLATMYFQGHTHRTCSLNELKTRTHYIDIRTYSMLNERFVIENE
jgi:hypothetical protein